MFSVDNVNFFPTFWNKYSILFLLYSVSQINSIKHSKITQNLYFFIFLLNLFKMVELMYKASYRNVVLTYDLWWNLTQSAKNSHQKRSSTLNITLNSTALTFISGQRAHCFKCKLRANWWNFHYIIFRFIDSFPAITLSVPGGTPLIIHIQMFRFTFLQHWKKHPGFPFGEAQKILVKGDSSPLPPLNRLVMWGLK